jgi:hypothetical protein
VPFISRKVEPNCWSDRTPHSFANPSEPPAVANVAPSGENKRLATGAAWVSTG